MYPNHFFSLFPPFPRTLRAFVAMSFDPFFDKRWTTVLKPALESVRKDNIPLESFRVDLSRSSDAILIEVLQAISDSIVIIADITAKHELDGRPVRNGNVMYEVGLAHAARLPEEVVLFRSDSMVLDFDIAGVRVHSYDPDQNPDAARKLISETVVDVLKGLEARRRTTIRAAFQRLTDPAITLLIQTITKREPLSHPPARTIAEAVGAVQIEQAIALLLELGAIQADTFRITKETLSQLSQKKTTTANLLSYKSTSFGDALFEYLGEEMGLYDASTADLLKDYFERNPPFPNQAST